MIVRIRQCCCALTTFVRLVAVFFLVFHLLLALSVAIWYALFATSNKSKSLTNEDSSGEVNDRTFDSFLLPTSRRNSENSANNDSHGSSQLDLLFVILLEVFAAVGILFNLLLMLGIKMQSRSLFLPWLVFHFITILACFAGGVYLALWFTILQTSATNPEDKFLSVLALFPFVGGIFLIFLWIFVDQLYIQMGQKKNESPHQGGALSAPGSSVSTRKNPTVMVIDHSTYSTMSYATLPRKVLGVGEVERRHHALATPTRRPRHHHHNNNNKVTRTKSMNSTAASHYTLPRKSAQSQQRGFSNEKVISSRHQRAKSLEHILDGSGSSGAGLPNYWIADGARLISRRNVRQQSEENMLDESSLETNSTSIPSYCTVDRRTRRPAPIKPPRPPISSDDSSDGRPPRRIYKVNSFQQQPQSRPPLGPHNSSVELILADEPIFKNCTIVGNNASDNQVMIHYDDNIENHGVTRFNEDESSIQSSMMDLDLNMLPLDSKILPQEAIRNYHHNPRRAGPRHRSGYNTDTIRSNHSAKSVTIANKVTEFHYSEDDLPSGSTLRRQKRTDWVPEPIYPQPAESPPPPPFPMDDRVTVAQTTPPPPTPPPPENLHTKSWLSRLSPIKSKHKSGDEDHFVDLYYSVSDVRL